MCSPWGTSRLEWQPVGVVWWLEDPLPRWAVRCAVVATVVLAVACASGVAFRSSGPRSHSRCCLSRPTEARMVSCCGSTTCSCSTRADRVLTGCGRAASWSSSRAGRREPALRLAAPPRCHRHGSDLCTCRCSEVADRRNRVARRRLTAQPCGVLGDPAAGARRHAVAPGRADDGDRLAVHTACGRNAGDRARRAAGARGVAAARPWVALAWCMHAAIAATMFVVFPYPLALIAFAPLFRLERLLPANHTHSS